LDGQSPKPLKLPALFCEVGDHYGSDSSSPSLKQAFKSEAEVESLKTVIMLVMTIGTHNLEEEMAATNAMMERLVEENEEKDVHIKLHEEKITRLTRKLEKQLAQSLSKSSESEE